MCTSHKSVEIVFIQIYTQAPVKKRQKMSCIWHDPFCSFKSLKASKAIFKGTRAGTKVCRGGCGIAIVVVYRDKSQYLAFAATHRDNILFPR